jgi:hypothetical protein
MVLLAEHRAAREICPEAFCSDSSGPGYALHVGTFDGSDVQDACRWRERWRFQELEPFSLPPRVGDAASIIGVDVSSSSLAPNFESSLLSDDLQDSSRPPRLETPLQRKVVFLERPQTVPPLVDKFCLDGPWNLVIVGSWIRDDAIHNKEACVSLMGLRRASRSTTKHDSVLLLSLGDNLAELLSFEKGRAKHRELSSLCRRVCSSQVASGILWHRR